MDWDVRFDLAFGASISAAQERKTKAGKLGIAWDLPPQATPHVPSLPSLTAKAPRHSNWGLHSGGGALHGWTKDSAHHHLTAPPTGRDGGGVAPLYTVVLPGAKVRMGDHHATALQDHLARQRAAAWDAGMSQTTGGRGLPQQSHISTTGSPFISSTQHTAQGVRGMVSSTAKLPVQAAGNSRLASSQPLAANQEDARSPLSRTRGRGDGSPLQVHGVELGGQPSQSHSPRHISPNSLPLPTLSQELGPQGPTHKPQQEQQGQAPDPQAPLSPQSVPALPSMNLMECMQGEASVLPSLDEDATQGLDSTSRTTAETPSEGRHLFLSGPLPTAQHSHRSGVAASQTGGTRHPNKPHTAHTAASVPTGKDHAKALLQQQLLLQQQQEQQQRQYLYQFHFMQHPQHPRHASRHMQATTLQAALHNNNSPATHFELVRYPPFVQSYSPLARPFPALRSRVLKNRQESQSWAGHPMPSCTTTRQPYQHPNPHLVSSPEGVMFTEGSRQLGQSAPVQSTQQVPHALPSSGMQALPAGQAPVLNAPMQQQQKQQQQDQLQMEGVQEQQQQQQQRFEGVQEQQQQQQQQEQSQQRDGVQEQQEQQQQEESQLRDGVQEQQEQQQQGQPQQSEGVHQQQQQQQQQQHKDDQQQDEHGHDQQQLQRQEPNQEQEQTGHEHEHKLSPTTRSSESVPGAAKSTLEGQAPMSIDMSQAHQQQQQQQQQQEQQEQQQKQQQQQQLQQQGQQQQQQQQLLQQYLVHTQQVQHQQQQQQQQAQGQHAALQAPLLAQYNSTKDKALPQSFLLQGSIPHPATLSSSWHGNSHKTAGFQGANVLGRGWLGQAPRHGAAKNTDSWQPDAIRNRLAASLSMPRDSYQDWPLFQQGSPRPSMHSPPSPDLTQELSALVRGVEGYMKKAPTACSLPLAAKTRNIHKTGPLPRLNPQQHIPAPLLKGPPTPPSKAMTYLNLPRPSLLSSSEGASAAALSSRTPMYTRRQGLSPTRELSDANRGAAAGAHLRQSLGQYPSSDAEPKAQGLQAWPGGQQGKQAPVSPRLTTPLGLGVLHSQHNQVEDSVRQGRSSNKASQGQHLSEDADDARGKHTKEHEQLLQSRLPAYVEVDVDTAKAEADARAAAATAAAAAAKLSAQETQLGWPGAGLGSNSRPPTRQGLAEAVEKVGAGLARRVGAESVSVSVSSQAVPAQPAGAAAAGETPATSTSVAKAPAVPDAFPGPPSNVTPAEAPDSQLASTVAASEAQSSTLLPSTQEPTPSSAAKVQPQESWSSGNQELPWVGADAGVEQQTSVPASKDAPDVWHAEEDQASAGPSPHTHTNPGSQAAGALRESPSKPPSRSSKLHGVDRVSPGGDWHTHLGRASFASRGSSYVDSMVEGLVASLPSRAVSAQGAPAATAAAAAAGARPATMGGVASQGAPFESVPELEAGKTVEETSKCAPRSWSPTARLHSIADNPSADAAPGSEPSKAPAAAAAGAELGAEAATQAVDLTADATEGGKATSAGDTSVLAPHEGVPHDGKQSMLTPPQETILPPTHAAAQDTLEAPEHVQLPTQDGPNASLSPAPPSGQDSSSPAERPPSATRPPHAGPTPPLPESLPPTQASNTKSMEAGANALQASKSKSMQAGADLLKGEPLAAVSMDDPSTGPALAPLNVRPHPFSAPVVMLQPKEVKQVEEGHISPRNGRPQHIEWDEDVCDVEYDGGAASRYSGSAPTSAEGSFTTGTTRNLLGSEDGEMMSVSAHGISAAQPLSQSFRSRSSSRELRTPEPPSVNDTISEDGTRLLGGKYEVQHVVGEGAYGLVMKCKIHRTDPPVHVAVKEFKTSEDDPDAEDVKRTSRREVALLRHLQHPNVVRFVDEFLVRERLFIVMEYVPCNLLELLEAQPGGMDQEAVRLIVYQLCSAISFIHAKNIIYRDIKPENLLVDEQGRVKLCDLGFARFYHGQPDEHLTDYVATRWYRAPELLLGPPFFSGEQYIQSMYGPPVDMWAIGCLMGELMDGEPLFPGDSDLDQLYRIQTTLGPITHQQQILFASNPHNTGVSFNIAEPEGLARRYKDCMSELELDFIGKLLNTNPAARMTGPECLQHPYLKGLWEADLVKEKGEAASNEVPPSTIKADNEGHTANGTVAAGEGFSRGNRGRSADGSSSSSRKSRKNSSGNQ